MRPTPWKVRCRPPRGAAVPIARTSDPERLATFASDAAHVPGGHTPEVCFPETEAAVAAVLAERRPVLVVGAQSSLTGGATPRGDVVLATARLATIASTASNTPGAPDRIAVGAGVVLADLARELGARGQWYPPLPTYDGATVGGTIATNAAGAATFKYGATRAWVRGLTVVLANGGVLELARGEVTASPTGHFEITMLDGAVQCVDLPRYAVPAVRKLAAGYFTAPAMDLVDLFIGAEGTLGVVTAAELGVLAAPPAWLVGLAPCRDEAAALALAADLRRAAGASPDAVDVAAIEYMDARSLALLREDGVPDRLGVPLPTDLQAALLFQIDLDPGTSAAQAAAEIARAGDATCDTMLTRLCRLLARHGVLATAVPALPGETSRRDALFALRESVPEAVNRRIAAAQRTIDPAISKSGGDVIVPVERLAALLARTHAILDDLGLDHAVWGHLSDGNVHPNVLPRRREDRRRAEEAQLAIGAAAIALGGSPLSEHGVGRNPVKRELLRRLYGDAGLAAMRAVKRALDPHAVLAPGVIFDPGSV